MLTRPDSAVRVQNFKSIQKVHLNLNRSTARVIGSDHRSEPIIIVRKYYFTNKVVPIWNSLPNDVVMADNINLCKKRLDKFWSSHDFVYLFRAQPLVKGSVK